uniref:dUTPase-like domain-containing protein n=1 Tax=Otus sunia TaxID=257818 RepID=A0A8C8BP41_9STRI
RKTEAPCRETPRRAPFRGLSAATRGSAGLDLAVGVDITIVDDSVHVVPSTVTGPLGHGLSALLIGRSSASKQGIMIIPGLIDSDYTGQIGIMVRILNPPATLHKGDCIAQLIPFRAHVIKSQDRERGDQGFGSTGPNN